MNKIRICAAQNADPPHNIAQVISFALSSDKMSVCLTNPLNDTGEAKTLSALTNDKHKGTRHAPDRS